MGILAQTMRARLDELKRHSDQLDRDHADARRLLDQAKRDADALDALAERC